MKKFDDWNDHKKFLHEATSKPGQDIFIKAREMRITRLGVNLGFEQDGDKDNFTRPVLVIKRLGAMYFVVPMTSRGKDNKFYYNLSNKYFGHTSRLILSQARVLDKKRFATKIGMVSQQDFFDIKEKLKAFLL